MNAQRATQDLCIDAAFVDSLLCARNAIAGAALAFAGCITLSVALPVIGWGICLAVAAATYAGWMALCLIDYMVKVNACRLRFLQDALLFCGVYIAWI
jgi:hypothetical protein